MSEHKPYKEMKDKIALWLDTRDKRFIFLWILFPGAASRIELEGSADDCAYKMIDWFERAGHLGELERAVEKHL